MGKNKNNQTARHPAGRSTHGSFHANTIKRANANMETNANSPITRKKLADTK